MAEPNIKLAKRLNIIAWILTIIVLLLVGMMRQIDTISLGIDLSVLPGFHAVLNSLAAICLIFALFFIRKGKKEVHRKFIYVAISISVLFLLSYVLYHFTNEETVYGGEGILRTIYLVILLSHIALAAGTFPFILFTFIRAYTGQYAKHKKMARWVYPLWLYVTISGPICYLMLRPYY